MKAAGMPITTRAIRDCGQSYEVSEPDSRRTSSEGRDHGIASSDTAVTRTARHKRLIILTAMLLESETVRVDRVCERFNVHRRTVMRDLVCLREAGLHVVYFPGEDRCRVVDRAVKPSRSR